MTEREYEPVHPRGGFSIRKTLERIGALALLVGTTAVKWGFVFVKFFSFFISVGAYALLFHSWTFAFGFVVMILIHELGHAFEARRQGLQVSAPTFIPFIGAYVTIKHAGLSPWRSALISLAGPFAGGLAALVAWGIGEYYDSHTLIVLANIAFLLNAFNMIPIGFLDGGQVFRAIVEAWRMPVIKFEGAVPVQALAPDRTRAALIAFMYTTLAGLLVLGLLATNPG